MSKNFLLGYGERLASPLSHVSGGGKKAYSYTVAQARSRLMPKIADTSKTLKKLPKSACPRGQTIALFTLHPSFIAKSYFPEHLIEKLGMTPVGSRFREVKPERWARKDVPKSARTSEILVAGHLSNFAEASAAMKIWSEDDIAARDLRKIEDIRAWPLEEKIHPPMSDGDEVLLEVVLHVPEGTRFLHILEAFEAFLGDFGLKADFDRRFEVGGLCFVPLPSPRERISDVAQFSFLRIIRGMPRLRQFRPITRIAPGFGPLSVRLPDTPAISQDFRAAVFDGGIGNDFGEWVSNVSISNTGKPVPAFVRHGTAVTSALLFGPLQGDRQASVPYCCVDHYCVLDDNLEEEDDVELYSVLARIRDVLSTGSHRFVNLSIGPDLPIEDNDVHAWTAVLDEIFADHEILATIAVGNGGESDVTSGNARIQAPADCVNGLGVGACDTTGTSWRRAVYSSIGPGRSPGVIKPDVLAFGGSYQEPYWVLDGTDAAQAQPITGTSFAAPTALRTALGVRAHFGDVLRPLALKALLLHCCEVSERVSEEQKIEEIGRGRVPSDLSNIVLCEDFQARVVYQGSIGPSQWVRIKIPMPKDELRGMVSIKATFCFVSKTDPQDPMNYTRSGLEVVFRPHAEKRKSEEQREANTRAFFRPEGLYHTESELRADAHKWETTLHQRRKFRGSTLKDPVFDVHYHSRMGGRKTRGDAGELRYALIITIEANRTYKLYDRVVQRYRTELEQLRPVIQLSIHPRTLFE